MPRLITTMVLLYYFLFLMALEPSSNYHVKPSDFGINYEEVNIPTSDNLNLRGWLLRPSDISYKIVIISHNGIGNMANMLEIAAQFLSLGYNVLTYDYRGFGQSDPFEIKSNFFIYAQFEKDLNAAIDFVRKYHAKNRTIHLYGVGIGAGLSIAIGAMRCDIISKIIADSPYNTLQEVKNDFKNTYGKDLQIPLAYDKNLLEPFHGLTSKGASLHGILIIAGDKDPIYSVRVAKKLASIRPKITQVFIIKNATMETTFSANKEEYFKQIKNFLQ